MKDVIRVALLQPRPATTLGDPENVVRALTLLEKLRGQGIDLAVFPEYFPYQGGEALQDAARGLGLHVVAGLVEEQGDLRFSAATLIGPSGKVLGRQRKRAVAEWERRDLGISPWDGTFLAVATDLGIIGLAPGADLWGTPEAARALTGQGADILVNPAVFSMLRGHWKTAALARSVECFVPVVGVTTADYNALAGERRVHLQGGGSFVVGPPRIRDRDDFNRFFRGLHETADWVQTETDDLEEIRAAEIHLAPIRRFRRDFLSRLGLA